jgi:hypothetical protein
MEGVRSPPVEQHYTYSEQYPSAPPQNGYSGVETPQYSQQQMYDQSTYVQQQPAYVVQQQPTYVQQPYVQQQPAYIQQPVYVQQPMYVQEQVVMPQPPAFVQTVVVNQEPDEPTQADRALDKANEISKTCCDGLNNLCSTILGTCGYYSCFLCTKVRYSISNKTWYFWLMTVCLLSFIISMSIFMTTVKKDIDYKSPYELTTCQYYENIVQSNRCCDIVNCQCSECGSAPSCAASKSSFTQVSTCCNGYKCCHSACDTCTRQVAYDCNCRTTTSSSGKKTTTCSTCYRTESYSCNCGCKRSVSNELCSTACGTCYDIQTVYGYNTTYGILTQTTNQHCDRDDVSCLNSWLAAHPVNVITACWYDKNNPNVGAEFAYPKYKYNIAAAVFAGIFGSIMAVSFLWSCAFFRCKTQSVD